MDSEQAPRDSEQRYLSLFEASPLPMWVRDFETDKFLAVNDAAVRAYGYTREEFLAMTNPELWPAEDAARYFAVMKARDPMEKSRQVRRHRRKDGSIMDVEVTSHGFELNGRRARLTLVNDITGKMRAEEALRQNQHFLEKAQEVAHIGHWVSEPIPSGGKLSWSRETHRIFGMAEKDFDGRVETFLSLVHPDDLEYVKAERAAALAGVRPYRVEHRIVRPDGEARWVHQEAEITRDSSGNLLRMIGVTQDITERKLAEMAVRKLNLELEQRVLERTRQLEASNRELESFAYSVSHDLRAPLRTIDGFSQALLEDYEERLDATGKDFLRRIRGASRRMADLIDDLLALSRVARAELQRQPVDISALVHEIVQELERQDPGRKVAVSVRPGMTATVDYRMLRIALHNLLNNAWKFTSKRSDPAITVGMVPHHEGTAFFVRDNGVGFDMAYAGRLFGAFQRLHTEAEFAGTGVGLATVQRVVRRHGGKVWAEGAVGAGATFYLTLEESS